MAAEPPSEDANIYLMSTLEMLGPMNWEHFKSRTEERWINELIEPNAFGFQITAGTRWNAGMSEAEIRSFEQQMGFSLPTDYRSMLRHINGFDRECIDVHGSEEGSQPSYARQCYKYPDDLPRVQGWLDQISEFRSFVDGALESEGFEAHEIVGFVPVYGHRALVVFNDRALSPVISIVGSDVIIYGADLRKYVLHEFFPEEFVYP